MVVVTPDLRTLRAIMFRGAGVLQVSCASITGGGGGGGGRGGTNKRVPLFKNREGRSEQQ